MKIKLPRVDEEGRNYISYSQLSKWKDSKKQYIRSYFFGEPFEGNAYTDFGSKVGEALENNNFSSFDEREVATLEKVTRLDLFEKRAVLNMGDFYVLGFIDSVDKDLTTLIDYKTGDLGKISLYESEGYDQLVIYAAAIEQEVGVAPKEAFVELIERLGNAFRGEKLEVGHDIIKVPQNISKERIEKVKKDILDVATEISEFYRVFNQINVNLKK